MNMNKALQNLYHAVSDETTTKVNISKLLVDIHYAITGKESENKNNWSKIVNSMADNWPEGGGGSSDFSTATVTIVSNHPTSVEYQGAIIFEDMTDAVGYVDPNTSVAFQAILYKGAAFAGLSSSGGGDITVTGTTGAVENDGTDLDITGDCTITIS